MSLPGGERETMGAPVREKKATLRKESWMKTTSSRKREQFGQEGE